MQDYLQLTLVSSGIYLALLAPLLLVAYASVKSRPGPKPLLLFAVFVVMDVALVMSHKVLPLLPA
jgi:hypothetical protein